MQQHNLILQAQQEYQEKLAIKERMEVYYRDQQVKVGLQNLERIKAYLPEELQFLALRRNIAIAHLDFEPIIELIAHKQEFTVISGLNPSSQLHLGHKALFDLLVDLQKLGGRIFIPLTNDESYLDDKQPTLAEARKMALTKILPTIQAFDFDEEKTHIYVVSDFPELYNLAIMISKYVTMPTLMAIFGEDSLKTSGQVFYRGAVQLAQILLPQLPEFGGPKPTLIPVGIDQHPYILLARDIAKKMGFVPPSELVIKFQPSLKDPEAKMSGSKPDTAIYLDDSDEVIKKKIARAYTGSVSVLQVHQELGGIPEICSVFGLLNSFHPDDEFVNTVKTGYQKGTLNMGELKKITTQFVQELVAPYRQISSQDKKTSKTLNIKLQSLRQPINS